MALITTAGFHAHITPEQYHAEPCPAPALTNSGISTLLAKCPARFAFEHPALGPAPAQAGTVATAMGSIVHRLALGKGADYAVSPYEEYRTKEARGWRDETIASGRIPIKCADFDAASQMADLIKQAIAEELRGEPYETEVVIAWQRRDRWCRAMLDVWCPSLLRGLDLKTIESADDRWIDRAFASGYGRQDAWYHDGIERLTGKTGRSSFGFLFVEKSDPYLGRYAEASEAMRTGSTLECDRAFEVFDACMTSGEWPGYARRHIQPTAWQVREWTEAEYSEAA